jgi:hypothetical protein
MLITVHLPAQTRVILETYRECREPVPAGAVREYEFVPFARSNERDAVALYDGLY